MRPTWVVGCALALTLAACSSTSSTSHDGSTDSTTSDADGATSDGAAGGGGAAGAAAGSGGGGAAGSSVDGGADVATDAGGDVAADGASDGASDAADAPTTDAGDASTTDAANPYASLCAPVTVTPSNAVVTNVATGASAPAASTYTGGPLAAATYALTAVTHYGTQYTGPPQALYTFDPAMQTLRIVETFGGGAYYYLGLTYTSPDAHTLVGTVVCNSSSFAFTSFTWSYTATASALTLSQVGSVDVSVYTKQ